MKLQIAARKRAKIKMALQGPSGSGKSFSAPQIAKGLCLKWESIFVIDTLHVSMYPTAICPRYLCPDVMQICFCQLIFKYYF